MCKENISIHFFWPLFKFMSMILSIYHKSMDINHHIYLYYAQFVYTIYLLAFLFILFRFNLMFLAKFTKITGAPALFSILNGFMHNEKPLMFT